MCMDTLLLRVWSMSLSLGSRTSVHAPVQAMKCGHVYAPMSTIKQSLSVVMSDQVETLWVNFILVEWWLGNTPPPSPNPNPNPNPNPDGFNSTSVSYASPGRQWEPSCYHTLKG